MKRFSQFMEGKKTYLGIVVTVLALLGFGDVVAEAELAAAINNVMAFYGIIQTWYGRYATKK